MTILQWESSVVGYIIPFTLMLYDFLLTFSLEYDRFWAKRERPRSLGRILFFMNRYFSLVVRLPMLVASTWPGAPLAAHTCNSIRAFNQLSVALIQIVIGALMILRVYALYQRDKRVLYGLLTLAAIVVGISVWSVASQKRPVLQEAVGLNGGCTELLLEAQAMRLVIAWCGSLFADLVFFVLVLWKALRVRSHHRSLINVLIRDGAMYFLCITLVNVANILLLLLTTAQIRGISGEFVNAISSVLMWRLVLNLRSPKLLASTGSRTAEDDTPVVTTIIGTSLFLDPEVYQCEPIEEEMRMMPRYCKIGDP